jgi:hypothetical protein
MLYIGVFLAGLIVGIVLCTIARRSYTGRAKRSSGDPPPKALGDGTEIIDVTDYRSGNDID